MSFKFTFKIIIVIFFVFIALYLSLYTWNSRTQVLDRLASYSGLEMAGWIVKPGKWIQLRISDSWSSYVHLVDVQSENQALKEEINKLKMQLAMLSEDAASLRRLERLLDFETPPGWSSLGARVIANELGPLGAINSVTIDKGRLHGVSPNMPVVTPSGVMGRTFRTGLNFSTVLLLSDSNSRIPVVSSRSRVKGILAGQGYQKPLTLHYVHLNSSLEKGELLVTSGLAGIYPKGLPVAVVKNIHRSELSLFLVVDATALVDLRNKEEVLILHSREDIKTTSKELDIFE